MANRNLPVFLDISKIKNLYAQGFGSPFIARVFQCSSNTIYRFLKKHKILIRPQKIAAANLRNRGVKPKTFDNKTEKEISEKYQKYGVNASSLSKEYGCHKVVVLRALKRQRVFTKLRKELLGDRFKKENNPNYGNHLAIAGKKNCHWIEDRSKLKAKLHDAIRCSFEYKLWRKRIFERDNYKCKICDTGGYLEVHHIIPLRNIIMENNIQDYDDAVQCKDLWNINNGITLCRPCHDKTKGHETEYEQVFKEAINYE